MQRLKEHGFFVIIIMLCAVLRFIPLFDYQFTFDELSGLDRTQFSSFSELIEKGVKIDAHPALIQLVIFYLSKIFGYVTWIIKLPFLICSLGAVGYAYFFCLRNFSKQSGIIATIIFSFSLLFVFYAPIARMYMPGVFFSLGMLYYFFEIFFQKNYALKNYLLFGLFVLLAALNQHLNALFAFTLCLSGLFFLDKNNFKYFLFTCLGAVVLYLPHLPVTLYQLSVPGIGRDAGGWLEAPEWNVIFAFIKVLLGTGRSYLVIVTLIVASILLNRIFRLTKKQALLLILFVINFLIIYFYSVLRSPIYQHSSMLFAAPAFILLVSSFIAFNNKWIFYVSVLAIGGTLVYKSYVKKDYLNQAVKTVYEYQFERTLHYKKLYGENKVYPLFFDCDTLMQKIYFKKYRSHFDCKISSDTIISYGENKKFMTGNVETSSVKLFSEFISKVNVDYVTIASATPLYHTLVREKFPYLIENTQTQAINFKVYSRNKNDAGKIVTDDAVISAFEPDNTGKFFASEDLTKVRILEIDTTNEFPFTVKGKMTEVVTNEGQVVLTSAHLRSESGLQKLESCISTAMSETGEVSSYGAKNAGDFIRIQNGKTIYSELFIGTNFNKIKDRSDLNCYLWNRGKEEFSLTDFKVKVIDYWPQKWHYWD